MHDDDYFLYLSRSYSFPFSSVLFDGTSLPIEVVGGGGGGGCVVFQPYLYLFCLFFPHLCLSHSLVLLLFEKYTHIFIDDDDYDRRLPCLY